MKRLVGICIAMVMLLCSSAALAEGITVSGGLNSGNWRYESGDFSETAKNNGFYGAGVVTLPILPIRAVASYSSFSASEATIQISDSSATYEFPSSGTLLKGLVGYELPIIPLAIGVGYVRQTINLDDVPFENTNSGPAIGAFGAWSLGEKVSIAGEYYYIVSGKQVYKYLAEESVTEVPATGQAIDVNLAYQITDRAAIEVGYRTSKITGENDESWTVGGLYLGGRFSF